MAETVPNTQNAKRSASPLNTTTADAPNGKKQKQGDNRDAEPASRDRMRALGVPASFLDLLDREHSRDERKDITDDINAGTHVLVLEHNSATNAKCRADKCLAESLDGYSGNKIHTAYSVNLQEVRPTNEHWSQRISPVRRFYHVSCLESIGVDLAQHLRLQAAVPERADGVVVDVYQVSFHPAIEDWVMNKGKTFDAELYKNSDYRAAREDYKHQKLMRPSFGYYNRAGRGVHVGPEASRPEPVQPKLSDFIPAEEEMQERRLTEVLLDVMGGGHLSASVFSADLRIKVLEVWGQIPESLSETSIDAKLKAFEEERAARLQAAAERRVDEDAEAVDATTSAGALHGPHDGASGGLIASGAPPEAGEEAGKEQS
ncbi:hypothetical protein LTR36_008431 [Oleoguttula mirabilis]|uniref:Uncharacterized protein n=1 Tax=Oleoguttula mirabilis TaxID=1507867 RepID=A0AAV9J887_9PEZI|nr:hypothetical protein LTR36_008431 [Oleoguttula mirabilis]